MPVSRALFRLLRIRELEEEQSQHALESAMGELIQLEKALAATVERERRGRRLVSASVLTGELPDRLAGLEEARVALRHAAALSDRVESVEGDVEALRRSFLVRRVERRQAETLIRETQARDAVEAHRRDQRMLDEWHGSRLFRAQAGRTRAMIASGARAQSGCQTRQVEPDASQTLQGIRAEDSASSGIRKDEQDS